MNNLNTRNMNTKAVGWTNLFPCSVGVHIPAIEVDSAKKARENLNKDLMLNVPPVAIYQPDLNPANNNYVKMLSSNLTFTKDVIEDRCLFMMPYKDKYFENIFKPGDILSNKSFSRSRSKANISLGSQKNFKPQILPPLEKDTKEKAILLHKQALLSSNMTKKFKDNNDDKVDNASFFITAGPDVDINGKVQSRTLSKNLHSKEQEGITKERIITENSDVNKADLTANDQHKANQQMGDWDDYLLSELSQLTANWIVHKCMPHDKQKEKLSGILEALYGPPAHTDLISEELSDGEETTEKQEKPKKKWIKSEALLLSAVANFPSNQHEAFDPYSDENKAPFYRQPLGIRNKKKAIMKEEKGLVNFTAQIVTKDRMEPKPLSHKDLLNPQVGDKVYETDNLFQQEWLSGKKQLPTDDRRIIVMDTGHKFLKQLQKEVPEKAETWLPIDTSKKTSNIPTLGHRKWTALPEIIDESAGILIDPFKEVVETKSVATSVPQENLNTRAKNSLFSIAHTWRSQWYLSSQYADSTPEDLIKDMMDIQPHVRIKAISTLAKAAELMSVTRSKDDSESIELPEKLFVALECLLDDSHEQVRKAAAIALYSFNRPTDKAKERLQAMLYGKSSVDRWAAAQCLAHFGETDSDVIAEIIKQIVMNEDNTRFEQGSALLSKLSKHTTLVHCMVAEQLNSNSWRHRVMACRLLPILSGTINRDISQKLSELMWYDWHEEVRKAAGQCLGRAGQGKDVHDNIRHLLMTGSEKTKLEALNKLGQLGLMTGKLLPAFLECFSEPYISIRAEVCRTCGNIKSSDELILTRLVHLATFDPIWQVKALAIQALGKIGVLNENIKECLLWALRYEDQAGVRAEACHSLMLLNAREEELLLALQERLLVESNEMVREEMKSTLTIFGVSISEDLDTVKQIKEEIVKLCTRNVIASQIIINEENQNRQEHLAQMVCQTEADKKILNEKRDYQLREVRSRAQCSPLASHPSTPRLKTATAEGYSSPDFFGQDGITFSPNVDDKELEALLCLDGAEPLNKSRPATRDTVTESETGWSVSPTEISSKYDPTANDNEEADGESSTRFKSIRMKPKITSHMNITPRDIELSRLSQSGYFERKSILSREALKERQLLDEEVKMIYCDLEARYLAMINEISEADKGLSAVPLEKVSTLQEYTVSGVNITEGEPVNSEPWNDTGESVNSEPWNDTGESVNPEHCNETGESINPEQCNDTSEPVNNQHFDDTGEPVNPEQCNDTSEPVNNQHFDDTGEPVNPEQCNDTSEPVNNQHLDDTGEPVNPEQCNDTSEPVNNQHFDDTGEPVHAEAWDDMYQ